MVDLQDKPAIKWNQFRWIPVLFVCSLLISVLALSFFQPGKNDQTKVLATYQSNDPLQPLTTLIPAEVKDNLLNAMLFSLLVTGSACGIYVLLNRRGKGTQ